MCIRDSSTGASIENLGVKIYFSQDMTESIVGEANKDGFQPVSYTHLDVYKRQEKGFFSNAAVYGAVIYHKICFCGFSEQAHWHAPP